MNVQRIRLHLILNLTENGVQMGSQRLGGNYHRNVVNAVGNIVHADVVAHQNGQHLVQDTNLIAHALLGQGDDGEVLHAGDAGDEAVGVMTLFKALLNDGAGIVGRIGITDVQGDVLLADGENGAFMQHLRAGVAQLAQLVVGHLGNGLGIVDDAGVSHQNTGNVRPVFVDLGIQRGGCQRTGDVTAATGEGVNGAVGHHTVEAGGHNALADPAQLLQGGIGLLRIHGAVQIELHPVGSVHKLEIQICGHQLGGVIFTAADQLFTGHCLLVDALLQLGKIGFQIQINTQLVTDLAVAGYDHIVNQIAGNTVLGVGVAQIQQVCDLVVILEALAGSGDDHNAAAGVGQDNVLDFPVLARIRHGGATEFCYFHISYLFQKGGCLPDYFTDSLRR